MVARSKRVTPNPPDADNLLDTLAELHGHCCGLQRFNNRLEVPA
jgi:hypothetical protein